ncbi:hypothetical protein [Bradyrhizobium sp. JR3.5]
MDLHEIVVVQPRFNFDTDGLTISEDPNPWMARIDEMVFPEAAWLYSEYSRMNVASRKVATLRRA